MDTTEREKNEMLIDLTQACCEQEPELGASWDPSHPNNIAFQNKDTVIFFYKTEEHPLR